MTIEYDPAAQKQVRKLGQAEGKLIIAGLEAIAWLENSRDCGIAIVGATRATGAFE